mmetsp:Transcript_49973/g.116659  ORF Transcript_49973/g.116659 Transcript_49973/m.116659 type:complete len:271 (+) Transcript_49973:71-883(+)
MMQHDGQWPDVTRELVTAQVRVESLKDSSRHMRQRIQGAREAAQQWRAVVDRLLRLGLHPFSSNLVHEVDHDDVTDLQLCLRSANTAQGSPPKRQSYKETKQEHIVQLSERMRNLEWATARANEQCGAQETWQEALRSESAALEIWLKSEESELDRQSLPVREEPTVDELHMTELMLQAEVNDLHDVGLVYSEENFQLRQAAASLQNREKKLEKSIAAKSAQVHHLHHARMAQLAKNSLLREEISEVRQIGINATMQAESRDLACEKQRQ